MKKLPRKILVYQFDEEDGEPIYAVARDIIEISEDVVGENVGVYVRKAVKKFQIKRKLK